MRIHEVTIQKNPEYKTLADHGFEIDSIVTKSGISRYHDHRIKALRVDQFRSSSLDSSTDLSEGDGYKIVGVNNVSTRGLSIRQIESVIKKENGDNIVLLVKGGKSTSHPRYGNSGERICAQCSCENCGEYCGECLCLCTIQ